jgi:hypothetical protein
MARILRYGDCCPHTRIGLTLDPDWDLKVWKGPKSFPIHSGCVVEGLPMGADATEVASC